MEDALHQLDKNIAIIAASVAQHSKQLENHEHRIRSTEKEVVGHGQILKFMVGIPAVVVAILQILQFLGIGR